MSQNKDKRIRKKEWQKLWDEKVREENRKWKDAYWKNFFDGYRAEIMEEKKNKKTD